MTKANFTKEVATKLDVTQAEASKIVASLEDVIVACLHEDGEVPFMDGKFKVAPVKSQPEKQRRNPSTGEMFMAPAKPASQKVVFKPGKKLKEEFK